MKKTFPILSLLFLTFSSINAQESNASWSAKLEKLTDNEYAIVITADLKEGWHLYSQFLPEGGPLPTEFSFDNSKKDFELIGKTTEGETHSSYEEIFEMETAYFEGQAVFTQKIKSLTNALQFVTITATYQTCNDEACTFEPGEEITATLANVKLEAKATKISKESNRLSEELNLNLKNRAEFLENEGESNNEEKGLGTTFLLGFFGGLIALLTPCVFPMIPLTVSFFTKKTKKKGVSNAILYGVFITAIYLLLSLPFHLFDSLDPEILNNISTNVWLNVGFFVIFIVFAFSFFGYFEITLPHSWSNKMDSASDIGGVIGTFFMALTLAIVSFSCTGPILGSLLVGALSSDGGAMQLTFGMVGFGAALALPFTLFALFPNWLNNLPKSGGWLNTVKVVLGFLEIALALKFLSNADMVEHWGLLKREVFIGIWILVFAGLAFYLFGKIKFPHDAPLKKLGIGRIVTGSAAAIFSIYLISGLLLNTSLNALSGFAPPKFYSIHETKTDCPLDLNCFKDFNEGLAYAKEQNKPILLDFTGWACVNCRKMEENVWSTPEVYEELEKFVLISLYIDDRKELPKDLQFDYQKSNGKVKRIATVGSKWATLQAINFATASQPYYVQLAPDMTLLNHPEKYTDKATYLQWLQEGLKRFKK
ncbi:protein-disulfide reductase DsbD family protein [Flavicella sediminum]|uniref:protein-disulfide reductase DsbD family protein n=1 Tax=Flavicella sediminum TaxID=2585141 RepID=UPI00111D1C97|nr:cytochrome c biogenesis protein CcdA [Flavicella sediminum]